MDDRKHRTPVLIITTLSAFLTPFMTSSVNIALPSIGNEFGMSAILMGWVATAYILAAAAALVPLGRLADIFGRKRIFLYGTVIYTTSSFLIGIAHSGMAVIVLRVIQGVGGAMIFSTGTAMLTSVFPLGERGKVLGLNVAMVYFGLTIGPFLGGLLTEHFGWRSVFLAVVPLGVVIIYLIALRLEGEWADAKEETFDLTGAVIYCIALVSVMYGVTVLPASTGLWLVSGGIASLAVFILWEARVTHPLLDVSLFRKNMVFALSNLSALINYSATFAVTFLLSLYLQYLKGLNPESAGLVIAAQPVMQTIFSPLAGLLSDRIEPRITTSLGMLLTSLDLLLFTFITAMTPLWLIVVNLMIVGIAIALFSSPNVNAIMSSVDNKYFGVASGMMATMRMTGQMLSMGIAMLFFSLYIGNLQLSPSYYDLFLKSIRVIFFVFAGLSFVGIFTSAYRGRLR